MVRADEPKDIEQIFREGTAIDQAMRAAGWEAIRRHKQAGVPLPVWKDGKTVWMDAEELEKVRRKEEKE